MVYSGFLSGTSTEKLWAVGFQYWANFQVSMNLDNHLCLSFLFINVSNSNLSLKLDSVPSCSVISDL